MTFYFDPSSEKGCVVIFPGEGNTCIYTGTEVHTEPAKWKDHPMALRLAQECDFYLWFDDDKPSAPFYTVPRTVAAGYDSRGGYFVSPDLCLDWSEPLYYISAERVCYRIAPVGSTVADMGLSWRENMTACDDIQVFTDRADAEQTYSIKDLKELMEELQ